MKKSFVFVLLLVLPAPALGQANFVDLAGQRYEFQLPAGFAAQVEPDGPEIAGVLDGIGAADRNDFLVYAKPAAEMNRPGLLLFGRSGRHVATGMSADDFAMFTVLVSQSLIAEDASNPFGVAAVMDKAESLLDVVVTLAEQRTFSFSVVIEDETGRRAAMVSYCYSGECLFNVLQIGEVDGVTGYNEFVGMAASNLEQLKIRPA